MSKYIVWYQEPTFGCIVTDNEYGYFNYDTAKQRYDYTNSNYKRIEKVTTEVIEEYGEQS